MASGTQGPAHTLIVYGGNHTDVPIATDFVAISKKFLNDGLNPLCLTGIDLRDVLDICPSLVFGRADLGNRTTIYSMQEATHNRFYRIASNQGLKTDVLRWIGNVCNIVRPGDRIITIFLAHGRDDTHGLKLSTGPQTEWLVPEEIITAFSTLPPNVRLLVVNEGCYSEPWSDIAQAFTSNSQHVLVEAAAREDEKSYHYVSPSGKRRCSMFATAWIRELETYPEGQIAQHHQKIKEEMEFVPLHQETNTLVTSTNRRNLVFHHISHFILSPNIALAIMHSATNQQRHENTVRARSDARIFWASLQRFPIGGPGAANSASDDSDMEVVLMKNYLIDLGTQAQAQDKSPLATACEAALEGRGQKLNLQKRAVKTILWQQLQMERISTLIQDLFDRNLIGYLFEVDEAKKALRSHREQGYPVPKFARLSNTTEISNLIAPLWEDGFIDVTFNDGVSWLMDTLACNQLLLSSKFDMEQIEPVILDFLRNSFGNVDLARRYSVWSSVLA